MHTFGEVTEDSQRLLEAVAQRVAEVFKDYRDSGRRRRHRCLALDRCVDRPSASEVARGCEGRRLLVEHRDSDGTRVRATLSPCFRLLIDCPLEARGPLAERYTQRI
jgi:hypothetical protein